MQSILQVLAVILVAVAMALALAHALELPGKRRLSKENYYATQGIYYPGFTIGGGVGEAGGTLVTIALLFVTPLGSLDFWLTVVALLGLLGMQAVYWLATHPVNNFWLEGEKLDRFSARFFSFGANKADPEGGREVPDWTELRDRWEGSHALRAVLATVSFVALVISLA